MKSKKYCAFIYYLIYFLVYHVVKLSKFKLNIHPKIDQIMKKLVLFFCMALALCISVDGLAQKKKKKKKSKGNEAKEWKKKMKSMDPMAFKAMSEELQVIKSEAATKDRELSALRKQITTKEAELAAKDAQITDLKRKFDEVSSVKEEVKDISADADDFTKGIVYKVQIGAFRNKDLTKYMELENFKWEKDADGVKKYTIGNFRDYWEADTFKKYMREMGVKDAWIVAYEDNERKDIKEVLDTSSE